MRTEYESTTRTARVSGNNGRKIAPLLLSICLSLLCQIASYAQFNADLRNPYLVREFDWAMFIDAHDMKHYLNYQGSRFYPLTNVRINFRAIARGSNASTQSQIYEEIWYHEGTALGLRRYHQLSIAPDGIGVIIVGTSGYEPGHALAITNVLVRLLLDLELTEAVISVVLLPVNEYDQIATALGRYGFSPYVNAVMEGPQIGFHLRSYPQGKDQYYLFQNSYRR